MPSKYSCILEVHGETFSIDEFEFIYNFINGYANIRAPGDKFGAINEFGQIIIPPIYDGVSNFKNKFFLTNKKEDGDYDE